MVSIKPERYSDKYKGYLTYLADPKISAILLDTYYQTRHRISFGEDDTNIVEERFIKKDLAELLESYNIHVEKFQIKRSKSKKKLFDVPVEMRKVKTKDMLDGIRIRLTGNNLDSVAKKMDLIKNNIKEYGIEPKECIWYRDDLEEGIDEDEDNIEDLDEDDSLYKDIIEEPILEFPKV